MYHYTQVKIPSFKPKKPPFTENSREVYKKKKNSVFHRPPFLRDVNLGVERGFLSLGMDPGWPMQLNFLQIWSLPFMEWTPGPVAEVAPSQNWPQRKWWCTVNPYVDLWHRFTRMAQGWCSLCTTVGTGTFFI
jgi:hypothetical protein